jgi:hypothetical protein
VAQLPFASPVEKILDGAANRVDETFPVGRAIKVFFLGAIYDDASFESYSWQPGCFQDDQIVKSINAVSVVDDTALFLCDVMQD